MNSKESFKNFCLGIAQKYEEKGWKYSKTKHWITKKDKNFTYKLCFYSSVRNISDIDVDFYGIAYIISNKNKEIMYYDSSQNSCKTNGRLSWNIVSEDNWSDISNEFISWLEEDYMEIVDKCMNNLDVFVQEVSESGFTKRREFSIDIFFLFNYGSLELAEKGAQRFYESLDEEIKLNFRENYISLINGKDAVSAYGKNHMLNYSNFKTIIENKIKVKV